MRELNKEELDRKYHLDAIEAMCHSATTLELRKIHALIFVLLGDGR